jgi:ribosome-binding factor A
MAKHPRRPEADASWLDEDFDSSKFFADSKLRARARKTAQLCAQAERALTWEIDRAIGDEDRAAPCLTEVRPHPDASHLLLVLSAAPGADLPDLERRLSGASGRLRAALGRSISRKRVPSLSFWVLPARGDGDD